MKRQHARIHSLIHSVAILEKRLESMLVPSGIRHRQALVLDALQQIGPSSQQHLAKHFSVSPGTMSSMISRLETLGFIKRETSPTDRRTDVISITPDGVAAIADVVDVWLEGDKIVADLLGPQKSKQLFALTRELSKGLGGGPPQKEKSD